MEKRRPGRDVIGSVGGYKFPGVDRWIVGYRAGAKKADPGIVTLNTYSNNFSNPDEVQDGRSRSDRQGGRGPLQRRGRLRVRSARGCQGEGSLGGRRRRRPVLPRAAHPHERRDQARRGGLRRDAAARRRDVHDRGRHRLQPAQRRRGARQDQPRGAAVRQASGRHASGARSSPGRSGFPGSPEPAPLDADPDRAVPGRDRDRVVPDLHDTSGFARFGCRCARAGCCSVVDRPHCSFSRREAGQEAAWKRDRR